KDILFHCRKYGIPTNTSEDFAKKMNDVILPKTKKTEEKDSNIQLTEAEVNYWQQVFTKRRK
ncbi:MAG: NYN domain-containing protein, partial [Spirochaetota bacterium]